MDVDILSIHEEILTKFQSEVDELDSMKEQLAFLNKTLSNKRLLSRLKDDVNYAKDKLENKIKSVNNRSQYNFYVADAGPLIQNYKEILSVPIKVSFMGSKNKGDKEKRAIVSKYLEIAKKYTYIPQIKKKKGITCENCSNNKDFEVTDSNIYVCSVCSAEQSVTHQTSSYHDVDRVNISAKYMYDRKVHFRDCMNQYQGKQNSTISTKVYQDLEKEFESHHLLSKDVNNRFRNITKEHVSMFLKELGYTKHYENVHLIHYNITGIKPDDISHLEDQLLDDFDTLTALYDKRFKSVINRKNFINTQYVLYQLLKRHKHPCSASDFTILKTLDRKFFHDDICKVLFEELGWNINS